MIKEATVWEAQRITAMWSKMMQELGEEWANLNEEEYFINLLKQIKDPVCNVFVAIEDDALIGFVTGSVGRAQHLYCNTGFCPDLFVEKSHRGKGVNNKLVESIVDFFLTNDADRIEFVTLNKKTLMKVWDRKGYKPTHIMYRKEV